MRAFTLLVGTLAVTACSSPSDLTEENIATALEEANVDPSCVSSRLSARPSSQPNVYKTGRINNWNPNEERWLRWMALVDSGVATNLGEQGNWHLFEIADGYAHNFVYYEGSMSLTERLNVCWGRIEVVSVDEFTVPGEAARQSSRVRYSWSLDQDANPTPDPMRRIFPELQASGQAEAVLELTNNGWQPRQPAVPY